MTIFFLILFHLLTNSDVKWNECCWKVVINICKQAIKTLVSCFKNSLSKPILFFLFIATINNYTLWIVCGAFDSNLKIVVMSFWIKFWIKCHFNLHFNSLNEYHISFIIDVFFCIFDGDLFRFLIDRSKLWLDQKQELHELLRADQLLYFYNTYMY